MFLRISDKAADIGHKSIVLGVSIHRNYIVKTLILDLAETKERYVLAYVLVPAIAEEGSRRVRIGWVVLGVILPIEQISDRPMFAILGERSLVVAEDLWFVCTKITARYHC